MTESEFIDTVSDDLIFLAEGREALITHPLRNELPDLVTASFCRLLAIVMIQSVEHMLNVWQDKHKELRFDAYFGRSTNEEKIEILRAAFESAGVRPDDNVLKDFLAIKYLRNIVVHTRWKENEKALLIERGFPEDARQLGNKHWGTIRRTNNAMMFYIAKSGLGQRQAIQLPNNADFDPQERDSEEKTPTIVLTRQDFSAMAWRNIERVSSLIHDALYEEENLRKCFDKREDLFPTKEEFDAEKYKSAVLHASLEISKECDSYSSQIQEFCHRASDSWGIYWSSVFVPKGLSIKEFQQAIDVFEVLHHRQAYAQQGLGVILGRINEDNEEDSRSMLGEVIAIPDTLDVADVSHSLAIGELAYRHIPNIAAASLFGGYAQVVDTQNGALYREIAERVIPLTRLSILWYYYVEKRSYPDLRTLDLYVKFSGRRGAH